MDNQEIRDAIRKKADDIPVPDSLQPDQIEKAVKTRTQNQSRFTARQKKVFATAAGLAVICVAGLGLLIPYFNIFNNRNGSTVDETEIAEQGTSSDTTYDDIYDAITEYHEEQDKSMDRTNKSFIAADAALPEDASASNDSEASTGSAPSTAREQAKSISEDTLPGNSDHSETDTQVNGVMEGDIVKTDGTHIFTVKEGATGAIIMIYEAEGARVDELSQIKISQADCSELYIEGKTLIVIGNLWEASYSPIPSDYDYEETVSDYYYRSSTKSHITLYDISDPAEPEQIRQLSQSGSFNTSRISDGFVYTFTNYAVNRLDYDKEKPEDFVPEINGKMMPSEKIRLAGKKGADSYMVMTSLKLSDHADFADSQAILGNFSTYYMNQEHIYAVNPAYWWERNNSSRSTIVKYTYKKGIFSFHGSTKVRGEIKNSYYMHEYKGNFVFVYTRNTRNKATNGLCVMDADLNLIGEISDLGVDETIYSSYFIDNMAYFVTFRNTDPVFAVDISTPEKPKLRSELKLPGFSSYLHSFGDDMLIGIGASSGSNDQVKLSLFSIGKNYEIEEIDKRFEEYETMCYADSNHKCVFVDEERGLIGLGVENWHYSDNASDVDHYVIYQYKKGTLKKVLNAELSYTSNVENVRGVRIGEYFYIVDAGTKGGVEVYDINTWKKAK